MSLQHSNEVETSQTLQSLEVVQVSTSDAEALPDAIINLRSHIKSCSGSGWPNDRLKLAIDVVYGVYGARGNARGNSSTEKNFRNLNSLNQAMHT